MIGIKINNQEIYILEGTKLTLNVKNSIFDFSKIEGDVIYTFDIPAAQNDIIFNHARYVYVQRMKSYKAEILLNGIPFAQGDVIIQEATQSKYSIAIVVNPFPVGFSERKLTDNQYGDNQLGIEPTTFATHWTKICQLLKNSQEPDSIVKFPAFYDDKFYKEYTGDEDPGIASNATFGRIHYGDIGGSVFFIQPIFNRFIINEQNIPCQTFLLGEKHNPENEFEGPIRYNNYDSYYNTDSLVPAIQLSYLIEKVLNVAGYRVIGDFLTDPKISHIFYQSLTALDATPKTLYNDDSTGPWHGSWNCFTPSIPLNKHCPNLTNGQLINYLFQLLPISFYIDSQTKTIELSLAVHIKQAKSINLQEFVLTKETTITSIEQKAYIYKFKSFNDVDIPDEDWFGEVDELGNLPVSSQFLGKIALVKKRNALYQCIESSGAAIFWGIYGGNSVKITIGNAENAETVEELFPEVIIPSIHKLTPAEFVDFFWIDYFLTKIESIGKSFVYSTGIKDFDMILTYYQTERIIGVSGENYKASLCTPIELVDYGENIDLKTTGIKSLGEDYIKPFIEFIGNYEKIEYQFVFPVYKVLEVIQLLKPQTFNTNNQTRWVYIDGVKLLPIEMIFEFVKGQEMVKTKIKFAKPNIKV